MYLSMQWYKYIIYFRVIALRRSRGAWIFAMNAGWLEVEVRIFCNLPLNYGTKYRLATPVNEGLVGTSSTTTMVVGLIYDNYFCYLWEISPKLTAQLLHYKTEQLKLVHYPWQEEGRDEVITVLRLNNNGIKDCNIQYSEPYRGPGPT